jgi:hypothetical protein
VDVGNVESAVGALVVNVGGDFLELARVGLPRRAWSENDVAPETEVSSSTDLTLTSVAGRSQWFAGVGRARGGRGAGAGVT